VSCNKKNEGKIKIKIIFCSIQVQEYKRNLSSDWVTSMGYVGMEHVGMGYVRMPYMWMGLVCLERPMYRLCSSLEA
jgi:hypothetical protein